MSIVRGPFRLKWGDNIIEDVESVDIETTVNSDEYETLEGTTLEIDGSYKAAATITLLASDIPALAAILPQYFVPDGQILSTGETVNHAQGAIDILPRSCSDDLIFNNLDIISCANPGVVFRIVNARTKLDGVEIDNKVQKVMVKFVGEVTSGEAVAQFFRENTIHVVS